MIRSTLFLSKTLRQVLLFKNARAFSKLRHNPEAISSHYKSPVVEERFYKKPNPKCSLGEIIRIENIFKNYESYFDKEGIIAGWARTVRYQIFLL